MDFTNPKEMISRVKPGYFTDFNAVFTCSSEIDIREPYASCAKRKRMPRLSVLVIEFVPDLIIVSARGGSRLLAGFRNEIWVLPLRPGAVFRLHRVGRQTKVKNSVCAAREFQNEQALRRAEVEPASYKFNRMGGQLHFTLVSDKCKLRIQNVTQPWTKK